MAWHGSAPLHPFFGESEQRKRGACEICKYPSTMNGPERMGAKWAAPKDGGEEVGEHSGRERQRLVNFNVRHTRRGKGEEGRGCIV